MVPPVIVPDKEGIVDKVFQRKNASTTNSVATDWTIAAHCSVLDSDWEKGSHTFFRRNQLMAWAAIQMSRMTVCVVVEHESEEVGR